MFDFCKYTELMGNSDLDQVLSSVLRLYKQHTIISFVNEVACAILYDEVTTIPYDGKLGRRSCLCFLHMQR